MESDRVDSGDGASDSTARLFSNVLAVEDGSGEGVKVVRVSINLDAEQVEKLIPLFDWMTQQFDVILHVEKV